jgi:predicted protein tyrosine phosphatase
MFSKTKRMKLLRKKKSLLKKKQITGEQADDEYDFLN